MLLLLSVSNFLHRRWKGKLADDVLHFGDLALLESVEPIDLRVERPIESRGATPEQLVPIRRGVHELALQVEERLHPLHDGVMDSLVQRVGEVDGANGQLSQGG